ncbi:hypothetical protein [Streptomyces chrestomyceticus]
MVEELHQPQFLSRVQVQGAQHGGGVAAVGKGELEDKDVRGGGGEVAAAR